MFKTLTPGEHSLDRGQTFVLPDASNLSLACAAGTLWVTLDGDRRDHVLDAGESLEVGRNALVVVNALKPSRFAVRLRRPAARQHVHDRHESALRG